MISLGMFQNLLGGGVQQPLASPRWRCLETRSVMGMVIILTPKKKHHNYFCSGGGGGCM